MSIVCLDIESTGTDPAKDRIVQIAWDGEFCSGNLLVNPECLIPPEATEVHGISNEMVQDKLPFKDIATFVRDDLKEYTCILGFNSTNFDIPLLWEEFHRAGIDWDVSRFKLLDAGTLFKRREERTLSAAVEFYTGQKHESAHDATGDVSATWNVWRSQMKRYGLSGKSEEELAKESNYEEVRVDLAGKIVIGKDGRPVYNIGKAKGTAVEDDPGFGRWMLDKDFSENTKQCLREILTKPAKPQTGRLFVDVPF